MEGITIRKLGADDQMPYDLLRLADESDKAINDYLARGEIYAAFLNDKIVGECVLLPTRPFTLELINLAVDEAYQGKGIAKKLIAFAVQKAKEDDFEVLEVGTGNAGISQLALYQKCGFSITSVDIDFFRKHYDHAMFEDGIECRHMVRLTMDL